MRGTINKPHLTKNQTTSDFQFQLRSFQCQAIFAQPKFARTKFAQPSLLKTQICPEPNLSQPQPKFAPSHFCPGPIFPDRFLPRNEFGYLLFKNYKISSEIEKKNRKILLPTNFFIDISRKKLFSL